MNKNSIINAIGYASGIAAANHGCCMGPLILKDSPYLKPLQLQWLDTLYAPLSDPGLAAVDAVADICERLAQMTFDLTQRQEPFVVLGGDHSCAIGTWSGIAYALKKKGQIGLIWVDAHMDSHTPETTESRNIHGMPLAALLGWGNPKLTEILDPHPKLHPEHVCLVGVRSFESGEAAFLKKLGVRIFFMDEVKRIGMDAVMKEALELVNYKTIGYGLSIDVDAVDPQDAPGVASIAPDGIRGQELYKSLQIFKSDPRLVGLEISEFNPNLDKEQRTEILIKDILKAILM